MARWPTCFSGSLSQKSLTMGLEGVGPAAGTLGAGCAAWPSGRLPRAPFPGRGGGRGTPAIAAPATLTEAGCGWTEMCWKPLLLCALIWVNSQLKSNGQAAIQRGLHACTL